MSSSTSTMPEPLFCQQREDANRSLRFQQQSNIPNESFKGCMVLLHMVLHQSICREVPLFCSFYHCKVTFTLILYFTHSFYFLFLLNDVKASNKLDHKQTNQRVGEMQPSLYCGIWFTFYDLVLAGKSG